MALLGAHLSIMNVFLAYGDLWLIEEDTWHVPAILRSSSNLDAEMFTDKQDSSRGSMLAKYFVLSLAIGFTNWTVSPTCRVPSLTMLRVV